MSLVGLEESEATARAIIKEVRKSLREQTKLLKAEIDKVKFLLGDPVAARKWTNSPAGEARIRGIMSTMSEVEQLYLTAGNTRAANIFKQRMKKELTTKLTNLQANALDVKLKTAKLKEITQNSVLSGLTKIRREGVLREIYNQARDNGGFFINFGRAYLNDLVTLETKSAGSKTIGEYMANLYNAYEKQIKNVFVDGIVRGDSYATMQKNLSNATGLTDRKAQLIITTEANAIFNDGVKKVIQDNPLIKGYRFRAVLDSKTSKLCQAQDGKYIPKNEIKEGINYPPLHPRCRSTVTTVLVSEDEKVDLLQRYTKGNKNRWVPVPKGMTYKEYKDKFGFNNSKKPRTSYVPTSTSQYDEGAVYTKIVQPTYEGYIAPSKEATKRLQGIFDIYKDNYDPDFSATKLIRWEGFYTTISKNTGIEGYPERVITRQAQAEAGYDRLPLRLTSEEFDEQVQRNSYRKIYKGFDCNESEESFLTGKGDYIDGFAGTEVTNESIYDTDELEMALKSTPDRILSMVSRRDIISATTDDARINAQLKQIPSYARQDIFSVLAIQYGYDAVEITSTNTMNILNRSAVIVRQRPTAPKDQTIIYKSYSIVDDIEELNVFANTFMSSITKEEKESIRTYTTGEYRRINKHLRGVEIQTGQSDAYITKLETHINKGIEKYTIDEPTTVYRKSGPQLFGSMRVQDLDESIIGEEFCDGGFFSTSFSERDNFWAYEGVNYIIHIPAGKGYGAPIFKISAHEQEYEFLFASGTKFRVIDFKRKGPNDVVVYLEAFQKGGKIK